MCFISLGLCEKNSLFAYDAIEEMADDCKDVDPYIPPYQVDKIFWLICSGNYYNENPPIRIKGQKKELIEYLIKIT